jgi:hypothetical protein
MSDVQSLIQMSISGKLTIMNFNIIYNVVFDNDSNSILPLTVFSLLSEESELNILDCSFRANTELQIQSPIISINSGIASITNSSFESFSLSNYPFIFCALNEESEFGITSMKIINSMLYNISVKSTNESPNISSSLSLIFGGLYYNFPIIFIFSLINSTFSNLTNYNERINESSVIINGGMINLFGKKESYVEVVNCIFTDIIISNGTAGGILYINGVISSMLIDNVTFKNISGSSIGGVVYQSVVNFPSEKDFFNISNCIFENCESNAEGFFFFILQTTYSISNISKGEVFLFRLSQ